MTKPKTSYIPTLATLGSLGAGFMAIALAVEDEPYLASLLIISAVLLDSLDGALARMLGVGSDFGMQLDSLADVISFGVAPAVVVGSLLPEPVVLSGWFVLAAFPICAAIRLARFNVSQTHSPSHDGFIGLASTGAGACAAATVLTHGVLVEHGINWGVGVLPWILLLLAFLMVSAFPYPHVGPLLGRLPTPTLVATVGVAVFVAAYWEYEVVFLVLFWVYAATGPVLAVHEKIKAFQEAQSG